MECVECEGEMRNVEWENVVAIVVVVVLVDVEWVVEDVSLLRKWNI